MLESAISEGIASLSASIAAFLFSLLERMGSASSSLTLTTDTPENQEGEKIPMGTPLSSPASL